ncbi:MAG: NAD(P)-dependent oxidoreductase [Ferruginibacter sp.]
MIVITAPVHEFLIKSLSERGYKLLYEPAITYEQLLDKVGEAEGLIVTTRLKIDKAILDRAVNLKWIGRLGSGLEQIDTAYAAGKNILCVSSPEGNRNAVAEHALGMLLSLMNNIPKAASEVKEGKWIRDRNRGIELTSKTVGLVGFGNTGQAFANLLHAFDVTILAYDRYKENFGSKLVREANMEHICRYADVISFHVPLTDETRNMAGADFFNSLTQKPFILNTSRGSVVETSALVNALKENKIAGAGLDVLENEKIDNLNELETGLLQYLLHKENVLVTPHIAGYSHESFLKMSQVILQKLGIN